MSQYYPTWYIITWFCVLLGVIGLQVAYIVLVLIRTFQKHWDRNIERTLYRLAVFFEVNSHTSLADLFGAHTTDGGGMSLMDRALNPRLAASGDKTMENEIDMIIARDGTIKPEYKERVLYNQTMRVAAEQKKADEAPNPDFEKVVHDYS